MNSSKELRACRKNLTQNSKSDTKNNPWLFLKFSFGLFTLKVWIIYENVSIFFYFFWNKHFTLPASSYSSIYNIVIAINKPTIMNNQFEALNASKNQFSLFISHFLCTKTTSLSFSLFIHPKDLRFKVHRAIQAQDSWSLTSRSLSCWTSVCLEKLSKFYMKSIFF